MKRLLLLVVLGLAIAGAVVSSAGAIRFDSGDCTESGPGGIWNCPTGFTGAGYSAQLKGAAGCGPALPYQYTILGGGLPPGVSMSSSGLISGTPTTTGVYQFWVELSDQNPPSAAWCVPETTQRQFQITILQGLSLDTTSVPPATLNVAYSAQLTASPAGTQTWTVSDGALPTGLTLGSSNGLISGTPTAIGSFHFAVKVSDSEGRSSRREYTIDVANALTVTAPALTRSEVGVAFNATLAATGGTGVGTYTWSIAGGALPPGLALGATGTITGTPTTAGVYGATVQVADTAGRQTTLPIKITVASKVAISTLALRPAKNGRPYQARLKTTGGVIPTHWKVTNGVFPRGIRLDKNLGVISGTPRQAGRYRITVQVTDAFGVTAQKSYLLIVAPKTS